MTTTNNMNQQLVQNFIELDLSGNPKQIQELQDWFDKCELQNLQVDKLMNLKSGARKVHTDFLFKYMTQCEIIIFVDRILECDEIQSQYKKKKDVIKNLQKIKTQNSSLCENIMKQTRKEYSDSLTKIIYYFLTYGMHDDKNNVNDINQLFESNITLDEPDNNQNINKLYNFIFEQDDQDEFESVQFLKKFSSQIQNEEDIDKHKLIKIWIELCLNRTEELISMIDFIVQEMHGVQAILHDVYTLDNHLKNETLTKFLQSLEDLPTEQFYFQYETGYTLNNEFIKYIVTSDQLKQEELDRKQQLIQEQQQEKEQEEFEAEHVLGLGSLIFQLEAKKKNPSFAVKRIDLMQSNGIGVDDQDSYEESKLEDEDSVGLSSGVMFSDKHSMFGSRVYNRSSQSNLQSFQRRRQSKSGRSRIFKFRGEDSVSYNSNSLYQQYSGLQSRMSSDEQQEQEFGYINKIIKMPSQNNKGRQKMNSLVIPQHFFSGNKLLSKHAMAGDKTDYKGSFQNNR